MIEKGDGISKIFTRILAWFRCIDTVLLWAMVIGFVVRAWQFGDLPPGINQDEAATAYDSFSIVNYGVDRHLFRFPVMLISWGSGMYAFASYLEAPFIGLFGLTMFAVRLPFLLIGMASIPLFYVLLHDTIDRSTARLGALLLAICPWHIMISRWALDSNVLPFVFLVATVLLLRSLVRPWLLVPACAAFATGLYAYGTAYVIVPVFLTLAVGYGMYRRCWPFRTVLASAGAFAVVATPVALYVLINTFNWESIRTPFLSIPRLTGVPRYKTTANLNVFSMEFLTKASDNLSAAWKLLSTQDDGAIWNVVPGYGIAYSFSALLAILGFGLLVGRQFREKGLRSSTYLLAWCIASIVLVLFVEVNVNRANVTLFPVLACVAIAVATLWRDRAMATVLAALFVVSFGGFVSAYFGPYRRQAAPAFYASFGEAIRYASAQTKGEVCVTGDANMPYIFVLFHERVSPWTFHETVRYENPGAEFQNVSSFDRYRFGIDRCRSAPVLVVTPDEARTFDVHQYSVKRFERYLVLTRS